MSESEKGYYENRDLPDSRTLLEANIALEAKLEKAVGALRNIKENTSDRCTHEEQYLYKVATEALRELGEAR